MNKDERINCESTDKTFTKKSFQEKAIKAMAEAVYKAQRKHKSGHYYNDPDSTAKAAYEAFISQLEKSTPAEFPEEIRAAAGIDELEDCTIDCATDSENASLKELVNDLAEANQDLKALVRELGEAHDAIIWMTGSADFGNGGQAEEGFKKVVAPLLRKLEKHNEV